MSEGNIREIRQNSGEFGSGLKSGAWLRLSGLSQLGTGVLSLAQIRAFVPGSNHAVCAWLKSCRLCLAQIMPFVPGSNQVVCAWHNSIPLQEK
ncbi:hypothetical protein ACKA06_13385 [Rossellomorea oryzaecorticis]|uniref:Uncharacterized protein n=1 Tax=Rossellomorea oryzaecorticis TaxID=1396505 RepID=A0ABW8VR02_9BACI